MSNSNSPLRSLEWAQVDVFAEALHQGNQLAIFLDASGLTGAEMQALARETNLSETTFILPRSVAEEQVSGVRVRIFTTQEELPFAGHPTLGTASWLRLNRPEFHNAGEVRLLLNVGVVPVRFAKEQAGPGVVGEMRQRDPEFGTRPERANVASALGLQPEDLHTALPPQTVSTGLAFLIVPLHSLEAARKLEVRGKDFAALMTAAGSHFAYIIAPVDSGASAFGAQWHARMPMYGGEDPATGSAAGCAVSYLVRYGAVSSGQPIVIEQGIEMLRPSRIAVRALRDSEGVHNVHVAGRTIPVAAGRFFL